MPIYLNRRVRTIWFLLALATTLSARADVVKKELEESRYLPFRTIALLVGGDRTKIAIWNQGGAAAAFGAIGGLAQGSTNDQHSKEFAQRVNDSGLRLSASFRESLKSNLEKIGFTVILVEGWPKSVDKKDDFSHIKTDADVILCAWVGLSGYVSSPFSKDYEPWMVLNAKLVAPKDQTLLYQKSFTAGKKQKSENFEHSPLDPKFNFPSFDKLMENFDDAVGGLKAGQERSAELLAKQLAVGLANGPGAEVTPQK